MMQRSTMLLDSRRAKLSTMSIVAEDWHRSGELIQFVGCPPGCTHAG